jgi:hypothetical protein
MREEKKRAIRGDSGFLEVEVKHRDYDTRPHEEQTVITITHPFNDVGRQSLCIKGEREWMDFAAAILEIDRWRKRDRRYQSPRLISVTDNPMKK